MDRGAPEQEIRRTHAQAYGKFLNATEKARTRRHRGFGLRGLEQELETIYFQLQITHEHDKTQLEVIKSTEKKNPLFDASCRQPWRRSEKSAVE